MTVLARSQRVSRRPLVRKGDNSAKWITAQRSALNGNPGPCGVFHYLSAVGAQTSIGERVGFL